MKKRDPVRFYIKAEKCGDKLLATDIEMASKGVKNNSKEGKEDDAAHGFVAKNLPVGFRPGSNTIYVSSKL